MSAEKKSPASKSLSDRLKQTRSELEKAQIVAFIIPTADAHQSEYVSDRDKRRAYVSGFSGSAGTALVTTGKDALLWTDGRYFLQAENELTKEWTLMKQGMEKVPSTEQWIAKNVEQKQAIGIDPFTTSINSFLSLKSSLEKKEIAIKTITPNPIDKVWGDAQPSMSNAPLMIHPVEYAGQSTAEKIANIRKEMKDNNATALVVAALDETAWLFNLRGGDIPFNPVFMSYGLITLDAVNIYVDKKKVTNEVQAHLGKDITVRPYASIIEDLQKLKFGDQEKIWMDGEKSNLALYQAVPQSAVLLKSSPIALFKAVKNATELKGMRQSHLRDAVAKISFLCWLEEALNDPKNTTKFTEYSVAEKLEKFRSEQKDYVGLSFETIAASGPNAAIIHYKPEEATARAVTNKEMFLCDSGAQFRDGTTDVTRTVHFGKPTAEDKRAFTLVLKGHIGLARAVFPEGTSGPTLDLLARQHLWEYGLDYRHGTGHGVGAFLNVHEGPHGIGSTVRRPGALSTPLEPGMVVTNEPGYYEDGKFGIRIESVLIVKDAKTPHNFGGKKFYTFDTITLIPIQKELIDVSLLSPKELVWLNEFHADCLAQVGPLLKGKPLEWLKKSTTPIKA